MYQKYSNFVQKDEFSVQRALSPRTGSCGTPPENELESFTENRGNFITFMQMRMSEDPDLKKYVYENKKNNFTGNHSISKITEAIYRVIQQKILSRAQTTRYVSFSLDSLSKPSHRIEETAVTLRYRYKEKIDERLYTFFDMPDGCGQSYFNAVRGLLKSKLFSGLIPTSYSSAGPGNKSRKTSDL